jgi:hypothetical protein
MANIVDKYAKNFSSMPEDDLKRLSLDIKSLTPEAREALRLEMEHRNLSTDDLDWAAQPEPEKVEKSNGRFRILFRNIGIFLLCDVLYLAVIGIVISNVNGIDVEKLSAALTKAFLNLSVLLAILTSIFFVPMKIKTVWIIGAFIPFCAFMVFLLFK